MRTLIILATAVVTALFLNNCSKEQSDQRISTGDMEGRFADAGERITDGFNDFSRIVEHHVQRADNWLTTEWNIRALELRVNAAIDNNEVSDEQSRSLRSSVQYIRELKDKGLQSANGLSDSERALIGAAVERVEQRLDGWIAGGRSGPNDKL